MPSISHAEDLDFLEDGIDTDALLSATSGEVTSGGSGGGGGAGTTFCYEQTATSKSGSKIFLPCKPTKIGYFHIMDRHMIKPRAMYGNTLVNGAGQFYYKHVEKPTMNIIMDVINRQNTLVQDKKNPKRYSKTIYTATDVSTVKVIMEKGTNANGYSKYDWVIITAYPVY